ncbi:MAG: aldehyde ferredoxin oxidoreductase family protein [Anaerolineae bacterium]
MPYGYTGKVLKVDLSTGKIAEEALNFDWARKFIGGKGLGARYLWDLVKPGTDPLSPDNVFMVWTGPVTGTFAPSSSKYCVVTKGPETGLYLDSHAGGIFGVELKFAGYDGLIVTGKAKNPVYLFIEDGHAEIRDAKALWGKSAHEAEDALHADLGESVAVMAIGQAGEKQVKYACISASYYRQHGRGGAGAVMGSKNLKAIAARGTGSVRVAYPEAFKEACWEAMIKDVLENPEAQFGIKWGSPSLMWYTNETGTFPAYNFSDGVFAGVPKIDANVILKMTTKRHACYACPVGCGNYVEVQTGPYADTKVEGPEYETLFSLGSNCGVDDINAIVHANYLCDLYGLDTISTGDCIAWAMELFERGILTEKDTDGLHLVFGNGDAMVQMVHKIAKREDLGDVLAEGLKRAAATIGRGSERYAVTIKGMELPAYEPKGSISMALSYATSDRGGCHLRSWPIGPEVLGAFWLGAEPVKLERWSPENKAKVVAEQQHQYAAKFSMEICDFDCWNNERMTAMLWTATGFDEYKDVKEFEKAGERITNLTWLFNLREGMRWEDVATLPPRMTQDPLKSGPTAGHVVPPEHFTQMLADYCRIRGWDERGIPTREKLEELGLADLSLERKEA